MELEPFFYYFVITKTLNLSNEKWKLVYLDQYSRIKYIKGYMRQWYPHHTIRKKNIVAILHIYWARAIFLLFYDNRLYLFLINSLNITFWSSEFVRTCFSVYLLNITFQSSSYKETIILMGKWYPHQTILEKHIVAILHIYGARAILLLLYDNPW